MQRSALLVAFVVAVAACSDTEAPPTTAPDPSESVDTTTTVTVAPVPPTTEPSATLSPATLSSRIVVAAGDGSNAGIYVIRADGSGLENLTNEPGWHAYASWSPDGSRILFEAQLGSSTHLQIFVMKADGGDLTQLTDDPGKDAFQAQWSPDGSRIAFVRSREAYHRDPQEIWVMEADGSNQQLLSGFDSRGPVWSPDGQSIAFLFSNETYVIAATGGERLQITDLGAFPVSWSPDGETLVVEASRGAVAGGPHNLATDLWLVGLDGSAPTQLTNAPGRDWEARWSPDGSQLLFSSDRDGNEEIYLINAGGSDLARLTTQPGIDGAGRWSDDATSMLFMSNRDGEMAIYVMSVDGTDVTRVWPEDSAPAPIWFAGLEWSPTD